jgi:hypothetical protein
MNSALKDGACRCPSMDLGGPTFGSMTAAQPRDIHGRCGVGRASVRATDALEMVPRRTVSPVDTAAGWTTLRRVFRVHRDKRNARECSLVGQEGPQLGKSPTVVRSALGPFDRCPRADVQQILDCDSAPGAFGLPNDSLADPVVQVGGEPRFLPAPCGKQPLGGLGSFALEVAAKAGMALAQAGVERAAERLAVAVGRDVAAPKINAKIFGRITLGRVAHVDGHVEEEHSSPIDQIGLPAYTLKQSVLIGSAHPRHDLPAIVGQDRDAIRSLPRQDALVIDDGAVRPERRLDVLIALVDLDHLGDGTNGHLGTEAEVAADIVVRQFLQLDLVGTEIGEGDRRQLIACGIEPLHRPKQGVCLFRQRQELQLHGQVHMKLYRTRSIQKQVRRLPLAALSLPGLNAGASRARFVVTPMNLTLTPDEARMIVAAMYAEITTMHALLGGNAYCGDMTDALADGVERRINLADRIRAMVTADVMNERRDGAP